MIEPSNVRLRGGITGRIVPATITIDRALGRVRVVPQAPLRAGLPYALQVTGVEGDSWQLLSDRIHFTVGG